MRRLSYIESNARETLNAARSRILKSRDSLLRACALLALVHMLTVHPYLKTSKQITQLNDVMSANSTALVSLEPRIRDMNAAGTEALGQLRALLDETTGRMMRDFSILRGAVAQVLNGEPLEEVLDFATFAGPGLLDEPFTAQQMNVPALQPSMQGIGTRDELRDVFEAIRSQTQPDFAPLKAIARQNIVQAAYSRAQESWKHEISPPFLAALEQTAMAARQAANLEAGIDGDVQREFGIAADQLENEQERFKGLSIEPDKSIADALGTQWWSTVGGKVQQADAVAENINAQLEAISEIAEAPLSRIHDVEVLLQALRSEQALLQTQFEEHRNQLAKLSGASGFVPIDLSTFIGLFPLVIGLVCLMFLVPMAVARHDAAATVQSLQSVATEDHDTRNWLVQRVLATGTPLEPTMVSATLALGASSWVFFSAMQIASSAVNSPISAWMSCAISISLLLAVSSWDVMAIRRLRDAVQ